MRDRKDFIDVFFADSILHGHSPVFILPEDADHFPQQDVAVVAGVIGSGLYLTQDKGCQELGGGLFAEENQGCVRFIEKRNGVGILEDAILKMGHIYHVFLK